MKKFICISLIIFTACGGTLTDEQRRKVKEEMKLNEIKKLSDAQITDAAFVMGRALVEPLEKSFNRGLIDSLQRVYHVKIYLLHSGDSLLLAIEKKIVEAYTSGAGQVQLSDNIQRLGTDSVLYTKPVVQELPDGSLQFKYALGIRIPRKEIILSIKE